MPLHLIGKTTKIFYSIRSDKNLLNDSYFSFYNKKVTDRAEIQWGNANRQRAAKGNGSGEVVSLFVDNLPTSMSRGWLWQLFNFEGKVVDAYVSHKKRKNKDTLFGL